MGYDRPMNRRLAALVFALPLAAGCLSACVGTKAAPELRVTSVSAPEGRSMAEQFCSDLATMTDDKAIMRMATRASAANLSESDQDAIVDWASSVVCPKQF
jgi:hypothetical protein